MNSVGRKVKVCSSYVWDFSRRGCASAFARGFRGRSRPFGSIFQAFEIACFALAHLTTPVRADCRPPAGDCARRAAVETEVRFPSAATPATPIRGVVARPRGSGPFPAVALLHSCLGLPENREKIQSALVGWGYVALLVDDFSTRGLGETCLREFPEALGDALGARAYLAGLPFVNPERVAAVGYSQGGDTALKLAALPESGFRAAAAFYAPCANEADAAFAIPTLILIGARDDVTPAADCARLAARQPAQALLKVYPGAYHGFDNPAFPPGTRRFGMRLEYDGRAAKNSLNELRRFLAAELDGR